VGFLRRPTRCECGAYDRGRSAGPTMNDGIFKAQALAGRARNGQPQHRVATATSGYPPYLTKSRLLRCKRVSSEGDSNSSTWLYSLYRMGSPGRRNAIEPPGRVKVLQRPWRSHAANHPAEDSPQVRVNHDVVQRLQRFHNRVDFEA
jgi:hypothetical protein